MSKAEGISPAHGSPKAAASPGTAPQRIGVASYDSEQFPVLIRLPDLTTSPAPPVLAFGKIPPASNVPAEPVDELSAHQPPEAKEDIAAKRTRSRRTAADRDAVPRRYTVRGLLASLPSQALVVLVLAAVTALVYLLVQGTHPVAENQPQDAETAIAQESTVEPNAGSAEPKLWPVSNNSEEALSEPPGPASLAETPDFSRDTPSVLMPSLAVPEETMAAIEASTERAPSTGATSDGPLLTWKQEAGPEGASNETVEPVQGWPPGIADDAGADRRSVTPFDRAAYSPANSSQWPVLNNERQGSEATAVESATLNGTIDLPQPRVDYDRTRSGIY